MTTHELTADWSTGNRIAPATRHSPSQLRTLLVMGDLLAVTLGWGAAAQFLPAQVTGGHAGFLAAIIAGAVLVTMLALVPQRLYLTRVCAIQSIEILRLGRSVTISTGAMWAVKIATGTTGTQAALVPLVAGGVLVFVLLTVHRMGYRSWLRSQRRNGRFHRSVVLVGGGVDASTLEQILLEHPETGFDLLGIVGPGRNGHQALAHWPADGSQAAETARQTGATGAIVETSVWSPTELNHIIRDLLAGGMHVHVSSGLHGISARRMSVLPLAHEPLLYVEAPQFRPWQRRTKRLLDVVLGSVLCVVAFPLLAVAALAIKLDSPGPVIFRQERVGLGGRPFEILKLRTMTLGAAARLDEVAASNGRNGPLFKAASDPRVTRVGRILRASSIDELPQLWNVVRGTMSLVGPRPALESEVAQFDDDLARTRHHVLPGITGLWQVEARDNPSFGPYRRLDIFYVENWSVALDISILVATVGVVLARTVRALRGASRAGRTEGAVATTLLD